MHILHASKSLKDLTKSILRGWDNLWDDIDTLEGLQSVDWFSEITVRKKAFQCLLVDFEVLLIADLLEFSDLVLFRDGFESEFDATRSNWFDDSKLILMYLVTKLQMMANLTVLEKSSMIRLRADWASVVMESASSKMITLYPIPPSLSLSQWIITQHFYTEQKIWSLF